MPRWKSLTLMGLFTAYFAVACSHAPAAKSADKESPPKKVTLLSINDFHGYLQPPEGEIETAEQTLRAGGISQMSAYIDKLREKRQHLYFVSSGALVGASPLISSAFHDESTIEALNKMNLVASAVGNHEFDEGVKELQRLQSGGCHPEDGCEFSDSYEGADFQYLAANVVDRESGEPIFPTYVIKEVDGIEVGFVGLVTRETNSLVMPSGIESVRFKDEAPVLNRVADKLQKKGVETIVALIHKGGVPKKKTPSINDCGQMQGTINDTINASSDAVDVFITGHSHQTYICRVDGRLATSAMSYGRLMTRIDLRVDPESGDVLKATGENLVVPADGAKDADLTSLVQKAARETEKIADKTVGYIKQAMSNEPDESGESELGKIIADAQLSATSGKHGNADIAFMNSGGIRGALGSGQRQGAKIPVKYEQLHEIQPFGNTLVAMTMTGKQIHELLEQQWSGTGRKTILQPSHNLQYQWSPKAKAGTKIAYDEIRIDGELLDKKAEYRVTVNNFLANGGDGFDILKNGTNRVTYGLDVKALADYLSKHSPVEAPNDDRIRRAESGTK